MFQRLAALGMAALLTLMAGCNEPTPGYSRMLGKVEPPGLAFSAAKDVMAMYFDVDPARTDPDTGTITCRPKMVQDYKERLLGGLPTRQIATLQIVRTEGQLTAQVAVAIQQQGSAIYRTMKGGQGPYSGVPDQTPAEVEGATTVEQNETWKTIGYAYEIERKILDDLYQRLHPEAKEAASQP